MNHSKTGQRLTIQNLNMSGFQIPTVIQILVEINKTCNFNTVFIHTALKKTNRIFTHYTLQGIQI